MSLTISPEQQGLQLAADLTFPSTINVTGSGYITVSGIDTTSGLTEVLGLTGKHSISLMGLASLTNESVTIKLTVDGLVVWNDTFTIEGASLVLYGAFFGDGGIDVPFVCNSSLSLEVQMTADTSIDFNYLARPIL